MEANNHEKIIQIKNALYDSVVKTFEEMAFIDVAQAEESYFLEYSQIIYIEIKEPFAGSMVLYLPFHCKKIIIENIYSTDFNGLKSKEIDDCLLEILNVMAGTFLRNLYGQNIKYSMDMPKILFDQKGIKANGVTSVQLFFNAEGDPFKVSVSING